MALPGGITGSYTSDWDTAADPVLDHANAMVPAEQPSTGGWLQSAAPAGAGSAPGRLGYMFRAAERPSTRGVTTDPPNSCEGGVGAGATAYAVPVPMSALRQN